MSEITLQRRAFEFSLGFMLTDPNGLEVAVTSVPLVCMCDDLFLDQRQCCPSLEKGLLYNTKTSSYILMGTMCLGEAMQGYLLC